MMKKTFGIITSMMMLVSMISPALVPAPVRAAENDAELCNGDGELFITIGVGENSEVSEVVTAEGVYQDGDDGDLDNEITIVLSNGGVVGNDLLEAPQPGQLGLKRVGPNALQLTVVGPEVEEIIEEEVVEEDPQQDPEEPQDEEEGQQQEENNEGGDNAPVQAVMAEFSTAQFLMGLFGGEFTEIIEDDNDGLEPADTVEILGGQSSLLGWETTTDPGAMDRVLVTFTNECNGEAQTPDLTLEKSAPEEEILAGEKGIFTLQYSNTGTVAAHNVVITEVVPEGTYHVQENLWDCGLQNQEQAQPGTECIYTIEELEPGEEGEVTFVVFANEQLSGKTHTENTATITADNTEELDLATAVARMSGEVNISDRMCDLETGELYLEVQYGSDTNNHTLDIAVGDDLFGDLTDGILDGIIRIPMTENGENLIDAVLNENHNGYRIQRLEDNQVRIVLPESQIEGEQRRAEAFFTFLDATVLEIDENENRPLEANDTLEVQNEYVLYWQGQTRGGQDDVTISYDHSCLQGPQVFVEKVANELVVEPGDTITYTLEYRNDGGAATQNSRLVEMIPYGTTFEQTEEWLCYTEDLGGENREDFELGDSIPGGASCEYEIGVIEPGEVTQIEFTVTSIDAPIQGSYYVSNAVRLYEEEVGPIHFSNYVYTQVVAEALIPKESLCSVDDELILEVRLDGEQLFDENFLIYGQNRSWMDTGLFGGKFDALTEIPLTQNGGTDYIVDEQIGDQFGPFSIQRLGDGQVAFRQNPAQIQPELLSNLILHFAGATDVQFAPVEQGGNLEERDQITQINSSTYRWDARTVGGRDMGIFTVVAHACEADDDNEGGNNNGGGNNGGGDGANEENEEENQNQNNAPAGGGGGGALLLPNPVNNGGGAAPNNQPEQQVLGDKIVDSEDSSIEEDGGKLVLPILGFKTLPETGGTTQQQNVITLATVALVLGTLFIAVSGVQVARQKK